MTLETKQIYEFGPYRLDASQRVLSQDGNPVSLTPKVLETLVALVERHGRLVEKAELMELVWPGTAVEDGNLTFNISLLRKALGDDRQNGNRYIETVPRRGYRFVANVTVREPEGAATTEPDGIVQPPAQGHKRSWTRLVLSFGAAAVLAAAAFTWWLARSGSKPRILNYTLLASDFRDKAGPLLTDGAFVYFVEDTSEGKVIASVSVHGGQPRTIPTPVRIRVLEDINLERSEILAIGSRQGSVESKPWAIALPSGSARLEGDFDADAACWSPDGARLAYARGMELHVPGSGGTRSAITALPGLVRSIRWSPDAKTLRFVVVESRAETKQLWEIEADGTHLHPLLDAWGGPFHEDDGVWTTDGGWFVFVSERDAHQGLWALRGRRSWLGKPSPVSLTQGLTSFSMPAASRGGKKLFAFGHEDHGELMRYDSARGEFAPYLGELYADWVSFSRDGRWLAYRALPERVLWRARADGSQKAQLTFAPAEADGESWSPDGKRIAFRLKKPGKPWKVYTIAAEGGEPEELLPDDRQEEGVPTWSADGKQLAFGEVAALFRHGTGKEMVHICDLKTHEVATVPGSEGLWTSRWSPDGRYISAVTADKRQRLKLYDFASLRWRDLGAESVSSPTWSHDSKYLYYYAIEGAPAILRVRVIDGSREQVVSLDGFKLSLNWWIGLAPDDSPLVVRDPGTREIYALDVDWP